MTEAEWRTIARQMEEKLFADIPENDNEIEHPHMFSDCFNKRMEEVFALFYEKDDEINCLATLKICAA